MQRTIRVFENKLDAVTKAGAVAKRFRETPAEDINPVNHITFTGIVIPDVDVSFVSRLVGADRRIFFDEKKKLMIEDSLRREIHLPLLADDHAVDFPLAFQMIKQIVMKRPINAIQGLWLGL